MHSYIRLALVISTALLVTDIRDATAQNSRKLREIALAKLAEEYERTITLRSAALKKAGNDTEQRKAARKKYPTKEYPKRFLRFAREAHDDESLEACRYLIKKFYISSERYAAMKLVTDHHLDKREIGKFLGTLVFEYDMDDAVDKCLLTAMKSKNVSARAHAIYQYALLLISRRNWCLDGDAERYEDVFDKESVARFVSEDRRKEIVALLNKVKAESRGIHYLDRPLVDWVTADLFAIQHLEIGQTAPDVKSRDSKGKSFRLSDYRGKVVTIVFWAHWCSACMADLPKETKFVARMQGRPFVWLGVNGDENVNLLQKAEKKGTVNFRSWHDGRDGAIAKKLNVLGWPAMYVIDHDGVIRYKSRISVEFDKAAPIIESLVQKVESRSKQK